MLWTLIYEFYVKYIFGGFLGTTAYIGTLGGAYWGTSDNIYSTDTAYNRFFTMKSYADSVDYVYSLGNYLSLIATIITMIIILFVIGHFIKKTFNLFGRII